MLHGIEARINEQIFVGKFGAMRTNDETTQEYYLVEWMLELHTVQKTTVMKGVDPPHTDFHEENICDAMFWNLIPNDTDWYTLIIKKDSFAMIILKQVLIIGLNMNMIDEKNILPSTCNKNKQLIQMK